MKILLLTVVLSLNFLMASEVVWSKGFNKSWSHDNNWKISENTAQGNGDQGKWPYIKKSFKLEPNTYYKLSYKLRIITTGDKDKFIISIGNERYQLSQYLISKDFLENFTDNLLFYSKDGGEIPVMFILSGNKDFSVELSNVEIIKMDNNDLVEYSIDNGNTPGKYPIGWKAGHNSTLKVIETPEHTLGGLGITFKGEAFSPHVALIPGMKYAISGWIRSNAGRNQAEVYLYSPPGKKGHWYKRNLIAVTQEWLFFKFEAQVTNDIDVLNISRTGYVFIKSPKDASIVLKELSVKEVSK